MSFSFSQEDEITVLDDDLFAEESSAPLSTETTAEKPATEKASEAGVTLLDDLSVDAEMEKTTPKQDKKNKTESVSVVETSELKGSSKTVANIVNNTSGVKIRQTGGMGSENKMSIRGMEGKNVKVLVNGVPMETSGDLGINDIPVDQIERIEVYKGYIPMRFATDGLGGAINVVTKTPSENQIDASYSFATYNTHRASLSASHTFKDFAPGKSVEVGVNGYFNHSDNDYKFKTPYMTKDTMLTKDHAKYTSYSGTGFVNLNGFWFDKISLGGQAGGYKKEYSGLQWKIMNTRTKSFGYGANLGLEKGNLFGDKLSFGYMFSWNAGETKKIDTSHVYYNNWYSQMPDLGIPRGELMKTGIPSLRTVDFYEMNHMLNVDWNIYKGQALNWSTLYKYHKETPEDDFGSEAAGFDMAGYPGRLNNVTSGLSLENSLFDSHFINLLGVKGHYYKANATQPGYQAAHPATDLSSDGHGFGYSENLQIKIFDPLSLKAGYQHSLRFPTSEELFGNGLEIIAAPELKPEEADNFNISLNGDIREIPFLLRVQYDIGWFYSYVDNRIAYLSGVTSIMQPYINMAPITINGYEGEVKIDVNEYIFLSGSMTWQNLRNKDYDPYYGVPADAIVPNVPRFYFNYGIELHGGDLLFDEDFAKIYYNASYTDEYYYSWKISKNQDRTIPKAFSQDIGIEYSVLANKLSWSFEVQNITDRLVYDLYGESKAGRTFATKIRYSFK